MFMAMEDVTQCNGAAHWQNIDNCRLLILSNTVENLCLEHTDKGLRFGLCSWMLLEVHMDILTIVCCCKSGSSLVWIKADVPREWASNKLLEPPFKLTCSVYLTLKRYFKKVISSKQYIADMPGPITYSNWYHWTLKLNHMDIRFSSKWI